MRKTITATVTAIVLAASLTASGQQRQTPAQSTAVLADNLTQIAAQASTIKNSVANLQAQYIASTEAYRTMATAVQAVCTEATDEPSEAMAALCDMVPPQTAQPASE